ncbi:hypothetical protein GJ496_004013 [Pomphorhynchus laevis]|nr:hypothetical protein GJ496_004013 [Pomphorhynchus laevis]
MNAIESALGDCKSETTELIRSCSLLLRLLKQLYKPIIDEISNFDEPLNRLNNLKTWMKITKSFIEEDLKMAMVCSIPDFNKIAFYLDSEEGILNYEACIMIMLACFIAQSPSKTQLPILTYPFRQDNTDNQQPICLHTRFDLSSILVSADNNQISASLKLINDERFRIQFELFDVKNVFTGCFNNRYCNGNLVNNGDISLMSDDLYSDKSFDSSMALINEYSTIRLNKPNSSYRISSSTLSEMIEELETELDNRNTEIQQLKALVLQKSEELDKLRNKAQNFQDELAFKITYADQIDNLLEEASKVQHLEQQLKNAEKKIMESNVLQKSIKNLKEENERLRKEFDDLKFRELINHKNEQTKLQTEIKILTEKAAHFEETNIEKTKRLVELETELALFQNLTNTGSIKDVHSCKEMYTSEESMYVLHNDLPNDSIALSKESFACDNYICNGSGIKKWPIACKHFTNSTIDKQCQVDMCNKKSPEIGYNHQLISKHECYIQTEEYGTRNASIQTDGKLVKEMRRSINIENMPSVKVRDIQFHPTFSVVIQRAACSQHCSSSVNNRQHRRDRNSCGNKTASARFSASQVKRCSTKKSDKCNAHKRQVESNKIVS